MGFEGPVHDWFASYLANRQQRVVHDSVPSKIVRKRRKDKHDQSSVKIPPKSTIVFVLVKESWKKTIK